MATKVYMGVQQNSWGNDGDRITNLRGSLEATYQFGAEEYLASSTLDADTNTVAGPNAGIECTNGLGDLPCNFTTPGLSAPVTISGTVTLNIWASESAAGANTAINVLLERIGPDFKPISTILKTTRVTELGTSSALANFTDTPTSTDLDKGDRIRITVFGDDAGTMAAGFTFSANIGSNVANEGADGDSWVQFTEDLTFMHGVEFRDSGTQAFDATSSWSFTTTPAGVEEDDIMLAWIAWDSTGTTINSVPSGWALLVGTTVVTPMSAALYWKRAGPSEAGPYVWGFSGSSTGGIAIVAYSGCSTVDPFGPSDVKADASAVTTHTTPNLTPSAAENWPFILRVHCIALNLAATATPQFTTWNNGELERVDAELSGSFMELGVGDGADPNLLTTPQTTSTSIDSVTSSRGITASVHLTPRQYDEILYFTTVASDVEVGVVEKELWETRGDGVDTCVTNTVTGWTAPIQATDSAGGTTIEWYTPQLEAVTLQGPVFTNVWAHETPANRFSSVRIELAVVDADGTNESVWCSSGGGNQGDGRLSSGTGRYNFILTADDKAVTEGQRLRVRVLADDRSTLAMVSGGTQTFSYDGVTFNANGDSWIALPVDLVEFNPLQLITPGRTLSWVS